MFVLFEHKWSLVLSFFLLSFNTSNNLFNSKATNRISSKLGHNHLWVTGYKCYYISWPQVWPRGHRGQKGQILRKVSTQTGNDRFQRNFGTWTVSTFSTNVTYRENYLGSYEVTGGQIKRSIFDFGRFQWLRCQIVGLGQAIKSSHGDPDVRPFLRGQRSTERSKF